MNRIEFRPYQQEIAEALESHKYVVALLPRRAGKTLLSLELCIRQCVKSNSLVYYVMPFYRKEDWEDYLRCYKENIKSMRFDSRGSTRIMHVQFINGSYLIIFGCAAHIIMIDKYDNTKLDLVVFDEYALHDPKCYEALNEKIIDNQSICLFISTPKKTEKCEHLFDVYAEAIKLENINRIGLKFTVDDTQHLDAENLSSLLNDKTVSEDIIRSDFYCEF